MTAPSRSVDVRGLVVALVNAVTGSSLGCELHLTVRRALPARI